MSELVRRVGPHAMAKVGGAYVGVGLTMVVALAVLGGPEWGVPLLAGALVLALPFVLVLVWALESRRFQGRRVRD